MRTKSRIFICAIVLMAIFVRPIPGFAQLNYAPYIEKIEKIIAGNQDYLVLASIDEFGDYECTVDIIDEVGVTNESDSRVGQRVTVQGFGAYMFYETHGYNPKIGDNVLLSLSNTGNSNVLEVTNGAYLIDQADIERFSFIVPEEVDKTDGGMALTALYLYVSSNGANSNYKIDGMVVYTADATDASKTIEIKEQRGLIFVNDKGEITKGSNASGDGAGAGNGFIPENQKWKYSLVIILVGAVLGAIATRVVMKLEKRRD